MQAQLARGRIDPAQEGGPRDLRSNVFLDTPDGLRCLEATWPFDPADEWICDPYQRRRRVPNEMMPVLRS
jgi:hypothetical protein